MFPSLVYNVTVNVNIYGYISYVLYFIYLGVAIGPCVRTRSLSLQWTRMDSTLLVSQVTGGLCVTASYQLQVVWSLN